jgi:hypothetical protein
MLENKIIKVRFIKGYPEASNHLAVGVVLEENTAYLKLNCRTFHFRRLMQGQRNVIHEGEPCVRIIPWTRIEIIHELPDDTDWQAPKADMPDGTLALANAHKTIMAKSHDL